MKRFALVGIGIALAAICMTGCSWETGSDAESWSSSYDWVNFNGVYRSSSSSQYLVTDYTTTDGTAGSTDPAKGSPVTGPTDPTGAAGSLGQSSIQPGSVTVQLFLADGSLFGSYSDDGNGVLSGPAGSGTISYDGGSWSITLSSPVPQLENGTSLANFVYYVIVDGTPASGGQPGSTGGIYSFNLVHQGQNLTITDNNGSTYSGRVTQMASASGAQNTDINQVGTDESNNDTARYTYYESPLPEDGDTIIANFEVSGVSAAAMSVRIVGTLKGAVAAGVFTGRTLDGTWVEVGGKTGDIRGTTTAIAVTTSTETATDTATTETAATETATATE